MTTPYTPYAASSPNFIVNTTPNPETPTPAGRGRPRGGLGGAKRGRKPRGGALANTTPPRIPQSTIGGTSTPTLVNQQYSHVHWALPGSSSTQASTSAGTTSVDGAGSVPQGTTSANTIALPSPEQQYQPQPALQAQPQQPQSQTQLNVSFAGQPTNSSASNNTASYSMPSSIPTLDTTGLISFAGSNPPVLPASSVAPASLPLPLPRPLPRPLGADDDVEGDDDLLPAMADDDYSAQLSWQSQSKDNLKYNLLVFCLPSWLTPVIAFRVLMDNFSPAQYDRFEAYRRHALPKQAVRKVCSSIKLSIFSLCLLTRCMDSLNS